MKKKIVLKCFSITVAILLFMSCLGVHAEAGDTTVISPFGVVTPPVGMELQTGRGLDSQQEYYIMNAVTGSLLCPQSLSDSEGSTVGVRGTRAEQTRYQWRISNPQSTTATLTYVHSATGKVLNATTSGVTLQTANNTSSQQFSISRVETGTYRGLYVIRSGGHYLSRATSSSYLLQMISAPNQYSYWSIMEVEKGYADIYSFTYPEGGGSLYDSSVHDDAFVEYMDAFGFIGWPNNNELAQTAYENMTYDESVFVFRGHANPNYLPFYYSDGQLNGGIKAGSPSTVANRYYLDELDDNALSKQRVVLYLGCKTGLTESSTYNLVDETFAKGAQFVLGTTKNVGRDDSNQFVLGFLQSAADANTIETCVFDAIQAAGIDESLYDETNGRYPVYYVGDTSQYLIFSAITIE